MINQHVIEWWETVGQYLGIEKPSFVDEANKELCLRPTVVNNWIISPGDKFISKGTLLYNWEAFDGSGTSITFWSKQDAVEFATSIDAKQAKHRPEDIDTTLQSDYCYNKDRACFMKKLSK